MRKKKTIILISCLLVCLLAMNFPCYAETEKSDSLFYVTGEEADRIYEMLLSDSFEGKKVLDYYSLTILKESIAPVYTLDLLEYARTEELNVLPMLEGKSKTTGGQKGNVYTAKMITADGKFGGNFMFYIENGVAHRVIRTISEYSTDGYNGDWYPASFSYADHAARISEDLKKQDLVSANNVKFVWIDYLGYFFDVKDGDQEYFYSVGSVSGYGSSDSYDGIINCSVDADQILSKAKECLERQNASLKEKAEWEAQHPGEIYFVAGGYAVEPISSGCSHVEDILDIASYLNIDYGYGQADDQSLDTGKADDEGKTDDAEKIDVAKKTDDAEKADDVKKTDDAEKIDDVKKTDDAEKIDDAKKIDDTEKTADEVTTDGAGIVTYILGGAAVVLAINAIVIVALIRKKKTA